MKHRILILVIFLCLILPLTTHIAATPNANPSSLEREMAEARQRETVDLQGLAAQAAKVEDRLTVLELQRAMSDRKFQTQIELLEIRGRYARDGGRIEFAEEIEGAVARLRTLRDERGFEGGGRP